MRIRLRQAALAVALITTAPPAGNAKADAPAAAPQPDATAADRGSTPKTGDAVAPLDYTLLTHVVAIETLRAGSHDPSGHNDYVFAATLYGLLNSSEDRNLDFTKRKKVTIDLGRFGNSRIDSLAAWHSDEKTHDVKELRIDGDQIRKLVAQTMTELTAQESAVTVMVEIVMLKKNKKFFFFGDDVPVAKASYYPIPPTTFDTALRTNQSLLITDDKGTNVKFAVRYDKPAATAKTK